MSPGRLLRPGDGPSQKGVEGARSGGRELGRTDGLARVRDAFTQGDPGGWVRQSRPAASIIAA